MSLKYQEQPDWANRVIEHELTRAKELLAKNTPVEQVLKEVAHRVSDKLTYPFFKAIKDNVVIEYDLEESKRRYFEAHPKSKVADHMNDVD